MSNKLENYVLETEDGYITENQEAKEALDNLFIKLPSLTAEQWSEMFELMNSNSFGEKINANAVAFPQMLSRYVKELNSPAYEEFEKFTEIQNIKNPFEELSSIVKIY